MYVYILLATTIVEPVNAVLQGEYNIICCANATITSLLQFGV